jgi:hypothetical protein
MSSTQSKPRWKRALWLAVKIYAGFCSLILTAYLAFVIWSDFLPSAPAGSDEITLLSGYGRYMATEYPKRGDRFMNLASFLLFRSKAVPVLREDVLKYLGKPDFLEGNLDTGTLVFTYYPSGETNQWEVYAELKEGKLTDVGFNGASVNDHSGYRPYPAEPAPNQQVGANGRQPFSSETNQTSSAAATRRSP